MKVVLAYISPNATTRMISREVSGLFKSDLHEVIELDLGKMGNRDFETIDTGIFDGADLIGIGSPVYHMDILEPLRDFLGRALPVIRRQNPGIKAFIYLTYGGITSGKAFTNTAGILKRYDVPLVGGLKIKAPHFWHRDNYPDEKSIRTVNAFYRAMAEKKYRKIDRTAATGQFSNPKMIVRLIYPFVGMIGSIRKRPIDFDHGKCIKCRKCLNECPVGAIAMDDYPVRDKNRCIYCYHCTTLCPKGAVIFDVNKIKEFIALNKKIIGLEQPENEIFV